MDGFSKYGSIENLYNKIVNGQAQLLWKEYVMKQ